MPSVSLISCQTYNQPEVDQAIQSLGLIDKIVKPGQKVLLKVNMLMGAAPEQAITTHPAIVAAVIKEVKKAGGIPLVGDSSGNPLSDYMQTMAQCGFVQVCQKYGAGVLSFQQDGIVDVPSPSNNKKIKTIKLAKAVLDVDVIINLPKLKTHGWTLYTGAIKNLFGLVPGFYKSRYHLYAPQPFEFAKTLVDILEITKPQLHILDAVYGMEGAGPTAGKPRAMGVIVASTDAVALDAVCSTLIGYKPMDIDTTKIAHDRGLGTGLLEKIHIEGPDLSSFVIKDWQHSASTYNLTKNIPHFINLILQPLLARWLRVDPVVNQAKCTKCQVCVKSCPVKTIHNKNKKVIIDHSKCIMCYCCHELCKYEAIDLKRSWLARKMGI
ncbi:MAG: DUF362 domain-containing protein [bacterium]